MGDRILLLNMAKVFLPENKEAFMVKSSMPDPAFQLNL